MSVYHFHQTYLLCYLEERTEARDKSVQEESIIVIESAFRQKELHHESRKDVFLDMTSW